MASQIICRTLINETKVLCHRRHLFINRSSLLLGNDHNHRRKWVISNTNSSSNINSHWFVSISSSDNDNREAQVLCQREFRSPVILFSAIHTRSIHTSHWLLKEQESKVEQTVKALKQKLTAAEVRQQQDSKAVESAAEKTVDTVSTAESATVTAEPGQEVAVTGRKSLWTKIKDEVIHYYHGFRLFFLDTKVAISLLIQVSTGHTLSRRERRQLVRTVADMFRMLPFLVFVTIPFMEFLLPFYLTLFPGMLPSTFQTEDKKKEKIKQRLKVKLEMAKFLQETIKESAVQMKHKDEPPDGSTVKEFSDFMAKIRSTGEEASTVEIRKFSKFFADELTLDNMDRDQLIALCRILEVQSFGTNNFLRFQLRMRLRALKSDDRMIRMEGIDQMSLDELQAACRLRGMRATDLPIWRLRSQLSQWLELHLDEQIPPSLLLLSRALFIPEYISPERQLSSTLKEFTDALEGEARLKIADLEGVEVDPKQKLEVLRSELDAIKREKEEREQEMKERELRELKEREEAQQVVQLQSLLHEVKPDHLVSRLPTQKVVKQQETLQEQRASEPAAAAPPTAADVVRAAADATSSADTTAAETATTDDINAIKERASILVRETLADEASQAMAEREMISHAEIESLSAALELASHQKADIQLEKEELNDLKEEIAEHNEDMENLKDLVAQSGGGDSEVQESVASSRLRVRVERLVSGVDRLVQRLEVERGSIQEQIRQHEVTRHDTAAAALGGDDIDVHRSNLISIKELVAAVKKFQNVTAENESRVNKIAQALDDDHDGNISVDEVLKVLDEVEEFHVDISPEQMQDIIKLVRRERQLDAEQEAREHDAELLAAASSQSTRRT